MSNFSKLLLPSFVAMLSFTACEYDPYNSNYPYPSGGGGYPQYPSYPNNYPPPNYPNSYPPSYPPQGGYNYPGNYDNNGYIPSHHRPDHHDDRRDDNHRPTYTPPPPPPPPPQQQEVRPSCPSGTVFDGSHCKITDSNLKRPGGDGNINPCPRGMWFSGGKCIKG